MPVVSDDEPAPRVPPAPAQSLCGRVYGDGPECAHGECDDCQLARGEDPINWSDPESVARAMRYAQRVVGQAAENLIGRSYRTGAHDGGRAAQRCECGSGVHVRGPGHSDYCALYER